MAYFKMIRKGDGLYLSGKTPAPHDNVTHLYHFLSDDTGGGSSVQRWINWINDPTETLGASNYSLIMKDKDNIILGCNLDDLDEFYKNAVTVSAASLCNLLREWGKIVKGDAEEVIRLMEQS